MQLQVSLDGQQAPVYPIEINYGANQFINANLSLFHGSSKLYKDKGNSIFREDYANGYALHAFNLTPDQAEDCHFNLIHEGNVRLNVKFGTALPNTRIKNNNQQKLFVIC